MLSKLREAFVIRVVLHIEIAECIPHYSELTLFIKFIKAITLLYIIYNIN